MRKILLDSSSNRFWKDSKGFQQFLIDSNRPLRHCCICSRLEQSDLQMIRTRIRRALERGVRTIRSRAHTGIVEHSRKRESHFIWFEIRCLCQQWHARQVDLSTNAVSTLAGSSQGFQDGVGSAAQFYYPKGVSVSPDGTKLYVADSDNHRIRQVGAMH